MGTLTYFLLFITPSNPLRMLIKFFILFICNYQRKVLTGSENKIFPSADELSPYQTTWFNQVCRKCYAYQACTNCSWHQCCVMLQMGCHTHNMVDGKAMLAYEMPWNLLGMLLMLCHLVLVCSTYLIA